MRLNRSITNIIMSMYIAHKVLSTKDKTDETYPSAKNILYVLCVGYVGQKALELNKDALIEDCCVYKSPCGVEATPEEIEHCMQLGTKISFDNGCKLFPNQVKTSDQWRF